MNYTEEEAKDKYCPMYSTRARSNCIGSDCMWWVWTIWTDEDQSKYSYRATGSVPNKGKCGRIE